MKFKTVLEVHDRIISEKTIQVATNWKLAWFQNSVIHLLGENRYYYNPLFSKCRKLLREVVV